MLTVSMIPWLVHVALAVGQTVRVRWVPRSTQKNSGKNNCATHPERRLQVEALCIENRNSLLPSDAAVPWSLPSTPTNHLVVHIFNIFKRPECESFHAFNLIPKKLEYRLSPNVNQLSKGETIPRKKLLTLINMSPYYMYDECALNADGERCPWSSRDDGCDEVTNPMSTPPIR